jgi:hypothetical protein
LTHLHQAWRDPTFRTSGDPEGALDDLGDWEVRAVRNGETKTAGFFRQCFPEDAVVLLMVTVRAKFDVPVNGWGAWTFWCVVRDDDGRARRTLVFEISAVGHPLLLADSQSGGSPQRSDGGPRTAAVLRDWEATGSNEGLHAVQVFCQHLTAGEAAQTAVERARAKYGPTMDLTTWRFFVHERFAVGPTLSFRADANDRAVQLDDD